ncbi:hypothetical protein [Planococcus halotolerans]|uniref:hypothetical protein n=1 Tax=Planococcus halotolerans TaxID=2233542 RepID=UPI00109277F4|nr:hypothetical protein [Planococcus halotolerans]QHJ70934.1 hypothetical protein DNR44_010065 [Planococcus halotolerans]
MENSWKSISVFSIILLLIGGCTFAPYTFQNTVIGTIEEIEIEEKFFMEDEFLVIEEENRQPDNSLYTIPVSDSEAYDVGQKVKVDIYSNTEADVWDLDHMKFEIEVMEE